MESCGEAVPTCVVAAAAGKNVAFKRFIVAIDDSAPSASAAAFALKLAEAVGAQIVFVGVADTVGMSDEAVLYGLDSAPMLEELKATTASRLAVETDRSLTEGVHSKSVVSEGAPA